jgi:hypothetical protein
MHDRVAPAAPWLWLAVGAAFSPAIVELVRSSGDTPRSAISVLAAVLLVASAWRERTGGAPARGPAIALLALASLLELFGILGAASTLSRLSVAIAVIGTARLCGRPTLPAAFLAMWLVPIPVSLIEPIRVPLEHGAASFVALVLRLFTGDGVAVGPLVRAGGQALELQSGDAGLHLAHLLALLGWYAGVLRGATVRDAARLAAGAALLVLPLEPFFLALAALVLTLHGPASVRGLLDVGFPVAVTLAGLAWAERGRSRADAA